MPGGTCSTSPPRLGLDLGASSKALEELAGKALTEDDEALVADFLRRKMVQTNDEADADASCDDPVKSRNKEGSHQHERAPGKNAG